MIVEYDWGCNRRFKACWPNSGLGWLGGSAVFVTPTLHGGALLGYAGAAKVEHLDISAPDFRSLSSVKLGTLRWSRKACNINPRLITLVDSGGSPKQ